MWITQAVYCEMILLLINIFLYVNSHAKLVEHGLDQVETFVIIRLRGDQLLEYAQECILQKKYVI